MKSSIFLVVFVLGVSTKNILKRAPVDPDDFLKQYGYLDSIPSGLSADQPADIAYMQSKRKAAISAFQMFYKLPLTGELDEKTRDMMSKPRCGVVDLGGSGKNVVMRKKRGLTPQAYSRLGGKWEKNRLTYRIEGFTSQMPHSVQKHAFYRAFKLWEDVAPLYITETRNRKADILLNFNRRSHGDNNPFDGRGYTLAHAFGPGGSEISGDVHFDDDELWYVGKEIDQGSDLYVAAAHEFGHSLGLGHSSYPDALMYPLYKKAEDLKLAYDDIRGIQTLYGSRLTPTKRVTYRPPVTNRPPRINPKTTTKTTTTTTMIAPAVCNVDIDQIVEGKDGSYLVFENDIVHTVSTGHLRSHALLPLSAVFTAAPSKPDVVFSTPDKEKIYIIKGNKVWRYTTFQLDPDYPKEISSQHFPQKPKFVLSIRDDRGSLRNFIFGSTRWWEYNFDEPQFFRQPSYNIDDYFRGVPKDVEYAVRGKDGQFYLVSKNRYVVFNHNKREVVGEENIEGLPDWILNACSVVSSSSSKISSVSIVLSTIVTLVSLLVLS